MTSVIVAGDGLNPEPSQPDDRAVEGLAPKSYADAAKPDGSPQHDNPDGGRPNDAPPEYTESVQPPVQPPEPNVVNGASDHYGEKAHRRSASLKVNGVKNEIANLYGDGVLEREYLYEDSNGKDLTTTRSPQNYKSGMQQPGEEVASTKIDKLPSSQERKKEIVSGRRAGQGWHRSRIRWAPLNIPLQRRLQTLTVLYHVTSMALYLSAFLFLCAIPILWPILVIYLLYCLSSQAHTSGTLHLRSERLRRSRIWSLFASYYPARLHRTTELEPTRKYVFGYHPHGIISHGAFAAFATEALGFAQLFPGITNTLLTLDSNFRIPLYRDYALALGLASVSKESCMNLLSKGGLNGQGMGRAITIVVGGARESLDAQPHSLKLVLRRRKGFVKLAIRAGADLVPVLGFGENELYDQLTAQEHPWVHKGQLLFKKVMGFTIPLFHARGVFNYDVGLLPYRRPVNVVVGRPIRVERQAQPDDSYVDKLHEEYIKELTAMWDEWKDEFARERKEELEIVE